MKSVFAWIKTPATYQGLIVDLSVQLTVPHRFTLSNLHLHICLCMLPCVHTPADVCLCVPDASSFLITRSPLRPWQDLWQTTVQCASYTSSVMRKPEHPQVTYTESGLWRSRSRGHLVSSSNRATVDRRWSGCVVFKWQPRKLNGNEMLLV